MDSNEVKLLPGLMADIFEQAEPPRANPEPTIFFGTAKAPPPKPTRKDAAFRNRLGKRRAAKKLANGSRKTNRRAGK